MGIIVNPQARLIREPGLILPRQPPVGRVRVDPTHWAGKYSVAVMLGSNPYIDFAVHPICSGGYILHNNMAHRGNYVTGTSDTDSVRSANQDFSILTSKSYCVITHFFMKNDTGNTYQYFLYSGAYGTFSIYQYGSGNRTYVNSKFATNTPGVEGVDAVMGTRIQSNGDLAWRYSNGDSDTANKSRISLTNQYLSHFGREDSVDRYFSGRGYLSAIFEAQFSDVELENLVRDPYQMFVPA